MTNNDDIVKGDVPPYMNDTLRLFYAELQKGETDYAGMLSRLAAIIDSKAREDQFRKDTDERVQSIKEAKQEQLDKDIEEVVIRIKATKKYNKKDVRRIKALEDVLHALQQNKVD